MKYTKSTKYNTKSGLRLQAMEVTFFLKKIFHEFVTTVEAVPDELDGGVKFLDMNAILGVDGDEELRFFLSPHQRCTACTLNLIATNEADKTASPGSSEAQWQRLLVYEAKHSGHQ